MQLAAEDTASSVDFFNGDDFPSAARLRIAATACHPVLTHLRITSR
jgi:hypothetical protein